MVQVSLVKLYNFLILGLCKLPDWAELSRQLRLTSIHCSCKSSSGVCWCCWDEFGAPDVSWVELFGGACHSPIVNSCWVSCKALFEVSDVFILSGTGWKDEASPLGVAFQDEFAWLLFILPGLFGKAWKFSGIGCQFDILSWWVLFGLYVWAGEIFLSLGLKSRACQWNNILHNCFHVLSYIITISPNVSNI